MKPTYPIFLFATDENLIAGMCRNEQELNSGYYERIDVESHLYAGWDALGYPIELSLEQKRIIAHRTSSQANLSELKSAIAGYAKFMQVPQHILDAIQATDEPTKAFELAQENRKFLRL